MELGLLKALKYTALTANLSLLAVSVSYPIYELAYVGEADRGFWLAVSYLSFLTALLIYEAFLDRAFNKVLPQLNTITTITGESYGGFSVGRTVVVFAPEFANPLTKEAILYHEYAHALALDSTRRWEVLAYLIALPVLIEDFLTTIDHLKTFKRRGLLTGRFPPGELASLLIVLVLYSLASLVPVLALDSLNGVSVDALSVLVTLWSSFVLGSFILAVVVLMRLKWQVFLLGALVGTLYFGLSPVWVAFLLSWVLSSVYSTTREIFADLLGTACMGQGFIEGMSKLLKERRRFKFLTFLDFLSLASSSHPTDSLRLYLMRRALRKGKPECKG